MLRKLAKVICFVSCFCIASCGEINFGDSGDDDDGDEIEESNEDEFPDGVGQLATDGLNNLPAVSDPVELNSEDEDQTELDSDSGSLETDEFDLVGSGISLGSKTTESKLKAIDKVSYAACEMINRARGFLFFAAQSDEIECTLGYMLGNDASYYDGAFHVVDLLDEGEVIRIKFKVSGTKEKPTGLVAYTCVNGEQDLFLTKKIEDGAAEIYVKSFTRPDNPDVDEFRGIVMVDGPVDENGEFNGVKRVVSAYSNKFSRGVDSYVHEVAKQSSKSFQYLAVMTEPDRDAQRFLSFVNLVDQNSDKNDYKLENLLLGDGGLVWRDGTSAPTVQGWNGSDLKVNNTLTLLDKLIAIKSKLPTKPNRVKLKFEGSQVYDCNADEPEFRISYDTLERKVNEHLALEGEGERGDEGDHGGEGEGEEDFLGKCGNYYLPQDTHLECQNFANTDGVD